MAPTARLRTLTSQLGAGAGPFAEAVAAQLPAPPTLLDGQPAPGLKPEEVESFRRHGFCIARGLLHDSDSAALISGYDRLTTQRAQPLHAEGLLSSLHAELPFDTRLAVLSRELPADRKGELTSGIDIYEARLRETFEFLFTERLLAGVESLIGPEITLSPIQHIRPFVSGGAGPQWHMDQAVTLEEADVSEIVTAWIPFVDTNPENGCLQFVDSIAPDAAWRSDRAKHLVIGHHSSPHVHVADRGAGASQLEVPQVFLSQTGRTAEQVSVVEATMRRGDVLLFNAYVPHRGGTNSTPDAVRWSMDLRFQATGSPTGRPYVISKYAIPTIT